MTLIIGPIDAMHKIPNPSAASVALPNPSPMASTSGTVIGPVVTPALCHATFLDADHPQNALDLQELVTDLGPSQVIYVGHSAGGFCGSRSGTNQCPRTARPINHAMKATMNSMSEPRREDAAALAAAVDVRSLNHA